MSDAIVYVVRHGRTTLNVSDCLRGRLDVALDGVGWAEAAALGEQFKYRPVAAIASSPLSRACDTAAAIAEATGVPCRVEEALVDRDFGRWAGGAAWR